MKIAKDGKQINEGMIKCFANDKDRHSLKKTISMFMLLFCLANNTLIV